MRRLKSLAELSSLNLPPAMLAANFPTVGKMIEAAKAARDEIKAVEQLVKDRNRYLTAAKWRYGLILRQLRAACKHGQWDDALLAIGEVTKKGGPNYQRVDEAIKIHEHYATEEEAGKIPVKIAVKQIRRATTPEDDDFRTPRWLFDLLDQRYHFKLDAAASKDNALCAKYITAADDALTVNWATRSKGGAVFVNPPFCLAGEFATKSHDEAQRGIVVAMIVPFYPSKDWFKETVGRFAEFFFIGRLAKYKGGGVKEGVATANNTETIVAVFRRGQKVRFGGFLVGPSTLRRENAVPTRVASDKPVVYACYPRPEVRTFREAVLKVTT